MSNLAFFPIGLSFLAFAISLLISRSRQQKFISLIFTLLYAGFGFFLLAEGEDILPLGLELGGWQAPFGITLEIDLFSALLITVTGVIYFAVVAYFEPGKNADDSSLTLPLIHILICGISGAFTTGDLFNLYVWFEVILLSSFVLLTLEKDKLRLAGAFKYIVLNILSSLIFLTAAGLIYNATHTLNLTELAVNLRELNATDPTYVLALSALLFVAFAIKSALFPFFFWLPASYHTLSPTVSALFAGLLTKVGLYAIFRINLLTFPASDYMLNLVMLLSCLSILVGVGGAIIQTNIRRILGFHIISQVGYISLAGIFILSEDASVRVVGLSAAGFYMIHHILVKANLFLVSGLIASVTGSENLSKVHGLISSHPFIALLFAIPALSLAGIPPFSGFWAKLSLIQASISSEYFMAVIVMIVGGFFTVYSMAKIWIAAFWGAPMPAEQRQGKVPGFALGACVILTFLTVTIGVNPDILYSQVERAARSIVERGDDVNR